jgi:hypothetical protein
MSEYQGNMEAIDFGTIYNNKPAAAVLTTHDRIVLFDSILNFEEAKELHEWLGKMLKKHTALQI